MKVSTYSISLYILLFYSVCLNAQVGIGTVNPEASLDVSSTNSGILIPRVSLTGTNDNTTVATGNVTSMLLYNTATTADVTPGFYYWSSSKWEKLVATSKGIWTNNAANNRAELRTLSDGISDRGIDNNVFITDSSNLVIDALETDDSNGNSRKIQVNNGDIAYYSYLNNSSAFGYLGFKARGTQANPARVNSNDVTAAFYGLGYNGTDFKINSYFRLGVDPSYDNSSTLIPGDIRFSTNIQGDSGEKVRITAIGKLGIGTNNPSEMLEIHGSTLLNGNADLDVYSYGANSTNFHIRSAAGSKGAPQSVRNKIDANFFTIQAQGYDGSGYRDAAAIRMGAIATNRTGLNDMPGRIDFDTTPDGGNNTIHRMRIDEQGHVGIGTGNNVITEKLVVEGKIKATSINFSGLVVFASDAAAGAGGLISGDIYKTNDGTLKIKM